MNKKELIDSLFVILCLYEDVLNPDKKAKEPDYFTYLCRIYVTFVGMESKEISYLLKGLYTVGFEIKKKEVKSIVFHMIGLIEKGEYTC